MKTINIIAPPNCVISSLFGIVDFTRFCNSFWKHLNPDNQEELFACQIYSLKGDEVNDASGFSIKAKNISEYQSADAVFLPSGLRR